MTMQDSFSEYSPAPPPVPCIPVSPPPLDAGAWSACLSPIVTEDEKTLGLLAHLLAIFTGFLGPLVLWLVKKDDSPYIAHHAREALNFQITLHLALIGLGAMTFILLFVFVGILLVPVLIAVPILALIAEILAAIAAQKGEWHRYPFCIRLV